MLKYCLKYIALCQPCSSLWLLTVFKLNVSNWSPMSSQHWLYLKCFSCNLYWAVTLYLVVTEPFPENDHLIQLWLYIEIHSPIDYFRVVLCQTIHMKICPPSPPGGSLLCERFCTGLVLETEVQRNSENGLCLDYMTEISTWVHYVKVRSV